MKNDLHEINNIDIETLLKDNKKFKGCYYKDKLPKLNVFESIIINLDNSDSGKGGTHWVALYRDKDNYCYFDSFGLKYPEEVKKLIGNKNILWNNTQFQNNNSVLCGYYAIYFIQNIQKDYYKLLYKMNLLDTKSNEKFLNNYFKSQV